MRRSQSGASGIFVAVVLILIAAAIIAAVALTRGTAQVERGNLASDQFARIHLGLVQYVAANGRLPCPANPALDVGDAEPAAASAACSFPQGTVPWKTIGIPRADSIDPWGGKIAYRVFSGATGLTQDGGASMVNCEDLPAHEPAPQAVTANGLCSTGATPEANDTTEAAFLVNKGLPITTFGTASTNAAYVLVSHGPSGLGAFATGGVQKMPLPANADELANLNAAGPFVARAASASGVDPTSAAHYDDLLASATVESLIRAAGRNGRNWPDTAAAALSLVFDAARVSAAAGAPVTPGSGVGATTLTFGNAQVTGVAAGAAPTEMAYGENAGYGGLGVNGGGSPMIQSSANELLRIEFAENFQKLGVTLNHFGFYGFFYVELVEFRFFLDSTAVGTKVTGVSCSFDGQLASFTMDAGAAFNRVEIVPLEAFNFFGAPGITALLVSEVKACPASDPACRTALDDPANAANSRCT